MTRGYHLTPARNLEAILAGGLRPDAPGAGATNLPGVYFHDDPTTCGWLTALYREPVVILAVDLTGLIVEVGDDDGDLRVDAVIDPARILEVIR